MRSLCSPALLSGCFPLLAVFLAAASGQQSPNRAPSPSAEYSVSGATPMPEDRAEDSYAIYSMLMPGEPFASMPPDENQRWAIGAVTVNVNDRNPAIPPQGQLKPPPENPHGFNDAVRDYETNKNVRVRLERKALRIDHAFDLLSPDQVSDLRNAKAAGSSVTSATEDAWQGVPGITLFSEVYFNAKHTAALVYMNDWCAHLCAAGTWVYLEKQGGHWVRRSGIVVGGA
jgi:hypothetical protein